MRNTVRITTIAAIILKGLRLSHKLLLAAPILVLLYFYGLERVGMLGPDEPRYAAIGREMALSGDWVTPRLWGEAWFEKPALLYWLVGMGNVVGLDPDWAPRLPLAALSVAFLIFYFFRLRREFGETAAWCGSAILATSVGWLAYSHVAVTDLPLAVCFAAAMLLAMPWVRSGGRRGLFLGGVFLGFAMLAKGLVPLVLAVPLVWVGRKRWPDLFAMGFAALAVAAPWYAQVWYVNGSAFIDEFFWKHHFSRFVSDQIHHAQPWWYYGPVLLGLLFPWTPALAALRGLDWSEPRRLLLVLWVVWGFVFFSASTNKLPGYILPLLPAVAALIGIQIAQRRPKRILAACTLLVPLIPLASGILPEAVLKGLSRAGSLQIDWLTTLIALAAALLIVVKAKTPVLPTATLVSACIVWLIYSTFPALDRIASGRTLWVQALEAGETECLSTTERGLRYGVYYYAGRQLPACTAGRDGNHDILDRD